MGGKTKKKSLVDLVWEAGVVGAGGAGFPTWKKLDARVDTVIANGAECEPLLRNDQSLMVSRTAEVVRGVELAMAATGAREGVIALKKKYKEATAAFGRELKGKPHIRIHTMGSFYPAGDEFVLVYEVSGRLVPEGGLPLEVGVVVSNVETFSNVARAERGVPVTSRFVTVTGAVRNPSVLNAPVGAPFRDLIAAAGGTPLDEYAVVVGGPMMGSVSVDLDDPVRKTTCALIVLPPDHPNVTRKVRSLDADIRITQEVCCHCSACSDVCPRSLLGHSLRPHLLMRTASLGIPMPVPGRTMANLCCECDLCGVYACPMGLPIGRINGEIKRICEAAGWEPLPRGGDAKSDPMLPYRRVPVNRLTFRLGLKPYDRKAALREEVLGVRRVRIPLKQHIGRPSDPVVRAGQRVKMGDVIGDLPKGQMGARVHASLSGTVRTVKDYVEIVAN